MQIKCNGYTNDVNLDFYPDTLKLKFSSNNPVNVDFLDLNLEIRNNNLVTKICDKCDNYDFETIKILHLPFNVHISVFRKIFLNNIRRVEKLCSETSIKAIELVNLHH